MWQEKLYSTIYIIGTALGITMVMTLAIYFYIRIGDIYPEYNRRNVYAVSHIQITPKDTTQHFNSSAPMSLKAVKNFFYPLRSTEAVTAVFFDFGGTNRIGQVGTVRSRSIVSKYVDARFWEVFDFEFLSGKPFTQADFDAGLQTAVISDQAAAYLFPDGEAVGRSFLFNGREYKVSGVVIEPSYMASNTFASVWVPYTVHPQHDECWNEGGVLGQMMVFIRLRNQSEAPKMRAEVEANVLAYEATITQHIDLLGQPDTALAASFRMGNRPVDMGRIMRIIALVVIIFLLVPALNLSGLNSSRMEKRLSEMGVRKAFGAPRSVLLRQVLVENFLLTLLGAVMGLLFSYVMAYLFRDMMMSVLVTFVSQGVDIATNSRSITPEMLLNLPIFAATVLLALVVNVLSAFIPAFRITRKNITEALHGNHKN